MLSWIGIRPRIFGGFALVLSFLVLLAGFATVQVEHIGGTVNELVTSAAGDAGMSQVRAALLASNGAVEKFIRTWNVGDKDAAAKAIEKVGKLADGVQSQYGRLQIVADGIGPVLRELEVYRSTFAAAADAVDRLRAATIKADDHGADRRPDDGRHPGRACQPDRFRAAVSIRCGSPASSTLSASP